VSEKFNDPAMMEIIPIYLGAKRIDEIYGEGSCIHLTGNIEGDIAIIKHACDDTSESLPEPLHFSRDHLLSSPAVNMFKAIEAGVFFKN
jgi:hypothetical protein